MREKKPIAVEMGRRAWLKRSKESLAELERLRAGGYRKMMLEDRKRGARKAAMSRRHATNSPGKAIPGNASGARNYRIPLASR
jgi:hypothetical protein